jgi:hypothetical protein
MRALPITDAIKKEFNGDNINMIISNPATPKHKHIF